MRVAVLFFGVARGLDQSLGAIRDRILAVNRADGIELRLIACLNLPAVLRNPRGREFGLPLDPAAALRLDAHLCLLRRQDDADIAAPLASAQRQRDVHGHDWASARNLLHQLRSLQCAWHLMKSPGEGGFDAVLFARPDLLYLEPIRLAPLLPRLDGAGSILIPPWHCWGQDGPGLNDRFALADPVAAAHYANRLELVPAFCADRPLHAETLLDFAMARGGCRVGALPVQARRVRATGVVVAENFGRACRDLPVEPMPVADLPLACRVRDAAARGRG